MCIVLHVSMHMCERAPPGCLHVVVILGLMKEFSASPLHLSPTTGVRMGGRRERSGGNGKGIKRIVVGEGRGKERGFGYNKSFFFCGF